MFYGSLSELSRFEEDSAKEGILSATSSSLPPAVDSANRSLSPTVDSANRSPSPPAVEHKSFLENIPSTCQLNLALETPVMKTPSKFKGNKRPLSSASPSVSSTSSDASLRSSKTAPSPAKRWKGALEDGLIDTVQPDPVAEMEEILNPTKVYLSC